MALFTDGPASTIEDLTAQDSQLLSVASAEGIDVTAKLTLAQEAVAIELEGLLREVSAPALGHVVVTPELRLWHSHRALEAVYRDAYCNQLNDRYGGKRDQFKELGVWSRERLRQRGVGIAIRPTPRAAMPEVRTVAGSAPAGTYYVTVAWVNSTGQEGSPASVVAIPGDSGGFVVVAPAAPEGMSGWNVYAGTAPDLLSRQNSTLLEAGGSWIQTQTLVSGLPLPDGQPPDYKHPLPRMLQRG